MNFIFEISISCSRGRSLIFSPVEGDSWSPVEEVQCSYADRRHSITSCGGTEYLCRKSITWWEGPEQLCRQSVASWEGPEHLCSQSITCWEGPEQLCRQSITCWEGQEQLSRQSIGCWGGPLHLCRQPITCWEGPEQLCRQPITCWEGPEHLCRQSISCWEGPEQLCRQSIICWEDPRQTVNHRLRRPWALSSYIDSQLPVEEVQDSCTHGFHVYGCSAAAQPTRDLTEIINFHRKTIKKDRWPRFIVLKQWQMRLFVFKVELSKLLWLLFSGRRGTTRHSHN